MAVQEVFEVIKELRSSGLSIFLIEQNVRHSLSVCDYAYVLEGGHVVLEGDGEQLLTDSRVKESYMGL